MQISDDVFKSIPSAFRKELIKCYSEIVRNYAEHRWEPAELNGGKICEIIYSILEGAISGNYPTKPQKPKNMLRACQDLERAPADPSRTGDHSLRILIPRLLPYLYDIRNNRGVGHVGGDVNPNHPDATAVVSMASWVMAELVRIFHGVPVEEAQSIVDALVERRHPLVWQTGRTKRVLDPTISKSEQTLILLYSERDWTDACVVCDWVEYKNFSNYKTRVLEPLHKRRLLEFDKKAAKIQLTPLGISHVEQILEA